MGNGGMLEKVWSGGDSGSSFLVLYPVFPLFSIPVSPEFDGCPFPFLFLLFAHAALCL
jgi:hypothetical protein